MFIPTDTWKEDETTVLQAQITVRVLKLDDDPVCSPPRGKAGFLVQNRAVILMA